MQGVQVFDSLDQAQNWILAFILKYGEWVKPRGLNTLEVSSIAFTLSNPRKRCNFNTRRRWSLPLAIGELCWHLSGSKELQFIQYYAKRWSEFSEDGFTIIGSCYGHKIFASTKEYISQWEQVINLLKTDPYSRRAILTFVDRKFNIDSEVKDIACACTLQFMIRDNKLHAIAHMRSNDAIWGFPYDIFLFTMLQEILACELGLELGTYTHFVGSMHIYENHITLAENMLLNSDIDSLEMPLMDKIEDIKLFLELESQIRKGDCFSIEQLNKLHQYWQDLISVLNWYYQANQLGGFSKVKDKIPSIYPYAILLKNMVTKAKI